MYTRGQGRLWCERRVQDFLELDALTINGNRVVYPDAVAFVCQGVYEQARTRMVWLWPDYRSLRVFLKVWVKIKLLIFPSPHEYKLPKQGIIWNWARMHQVAVCDIIGMSVYTAVIASREEGKQVLVCKADGDKAVADYAYSLNDRLRPAVPNADRRALAVVAFNREPMVVRVKPRAPQRAAAVKSCHIPSAPERECREIRRRHFLLAVHDDMGRGRPNCIISAVTPHKVDSKWGAKVTKSPAGECLQ